MGAAAEVPAALEVLCAGRPVLLLDDLTPEQEGALVIAAATVDASTMAFLVRESSGVVCVAMTGDRLDELRIPPLVAHGADARSSAFAVSVDLREGISTGISARDRAMTARALGDPATGPGDLVRPGHVLPLRARNGGVLERPRAAEAAVDLCRLAGLAPAGALAAAANPDGTMARLPELTALAELHDLPLVRVSEVVTWRRRTESPVRAGATAVLPTSHGSFHATGYASDVDGAEHLALVRGDPTADEPVLVRVHVECLTGDILGSLRCECSARLAAALAAIDRADCGVLVYVRGRDRPGVGLMHALRGCATTDERASAVAAHIVRDLGVRAAIVLADDPAEGVALAGCGLTVAGVRPVLAVTRDAAAV